MDFILHGALGSLITTYPLTFLVNCLGWDSPLIGMALVVIYTLAFIVGAFPDIVGAIGRANYGTWKLYLDAHRGIGFFKYMMYIPAYWLHVTLDKFTHKKEGGWKWWAFPLDVIGWAVALVANYYWLF